MAPRGGSRAAAMPDAMPDSLTEYEMDREERLVKNRAVLEVEQAVLQVSAARTGGVATDQADGGALAGHGSADARGGNKGGGDQSGSSSSSK